MNADAFIYIYPKIISPCICKWTISHSTFHNSYFIRQFWSNSSVIFEQA